MSNLIQGYGPNKPLGIIVEDIPTNEDVAKGFAISGYQDSVFRGFFREANLDLDKFWKTSLIKQQIELPADLKPVKGRIKEKDKIIEYTKFLNEHAPIFNSEVNESKPFLLLPIGELSFRYLTGLEGIRKFRGSVLYSSVPEWKDKQYKVLPLLGPYPFLNENFRMRVITRIDIAKIHKYLNDAPPPDNVHRLWVARSPGQLRNFLERSYTHDGLLVFDIETWMGIPTCLSFCFDGFESVCIPILDDSIEMDIRSLMLQMIAKVLASPIRKVNQNIKYDWKILQRYGFQVNNIIGDTMLAASTLYCEFPKNLGFLTSIYTDLPYFKDEGKKFDPTKHSRDQYYIYNAKDSLATYQVYQKQMDELDETGTREVYENLITILPLYKEMEDRGIRIDQMEREKLRAKYEVLLDIQRLYLCKLVNRKVNPNSPKQMNTLVFEELGYSIKTQGVKGTDEESLDLLISFATPGSGIEIEYARTILRCIRDCRKLRKVIELINLPLYPDNRFRGEYNLAGTETGRSSGSVTTDSLIIWDEEEGKYVDKDLGHSLQTIGKHGFVMDGTTYGQDIRNMFVPSRGYRFVESDLSQAEARVDAVLAGNFSILDVFDGPIGIHRLTGSWVYNCDPFEIKKNVLVEVSPGIYVERYYMAKTVRHAVERNMREDRLVSMTSCTRAEATRVIKVVHEKQPEIRGVFHHDIIQAIKNDRCLRAPNGRRRDFFDRPDHHTFNEGISWIPQAIVTDQVKFNLAKTKNETPWAYFLVEAHDGILAEVPIGREEEYGLIYKKNVEVPIDFNKCSIKRDFQLIIPCETAIGDNWHDMKEIKL